MPNPAVVIFNSLLLPPSQTFIRAQGETLHEFTPYYVGSRRVEGLDLPPDRTLVVNQGNLIGKAEEGLFKLTGYAPKLYQQVRQLNPVLIHAQFGLSGALVLPLTRSLKVPLLVHYRGADVTVKEEYARYSSLNHWIYFRRREALKREARLFITVSKFLKQKLVEQGFDPDKIVPHYHGVDLARFCPDLDVPREPVVLFVGRLTEKKGCEYLIQAMARVQSVLPDVKLVAIGDGPLRADLEAQAAKLLHHYQFLGVQPPEVVKGWMNRARLLAAPSVTASQGDSEGLPNVVMEAQAMALPVVGTFHAGIPEAVLDGETGFLAPERDAEGLADNILRLLKDPELWQRFSRNGREHMQSYFDRTKQTWSLEGIYQAVLEGEI
jgi:glycosyltransferase involved in cell wall biosynthesis